MSDRQLIADLLSALEYHTEQTRPIEFSKVAIEAAREYLRRPAQRKPLTDEQINECYGDAKVQHDHIHHDDVVRIARAIEAAHGIKGDA